MNKKSLASMVIKIWISTYINGGTGIPNINRDGKYFVI